MNVLSLLLFTGIINGLFLCLILFSKPVTTHKANHFLGYFILIITGNMIEQFITIEGLLVYVPHVQAAFVPLFFLLAPLYYFYVKSSIEFDFKFSRMELVHFIPAFVVFLLILPYYLLPGDFKYTQFKSFNIETSETNMEGKLWFHLAFFLQGLFYATHSIRLIKSKSINSDRRSNRVIFEKLKWLTRFSNVFLVFVCLYILIFLYITYWNFLIFEVLRSFYLSTSVFIYLVGVWSIKQSDLLNNIVPNSLDSFIKKLDLKGDITFLLEVKKLYTDPSLDLYKLSRRLDINTQYLSRYINGEFRCNFSTLVNSYRVNAAKALIQNPDFDHMSLLDVALEVGFTTKNTFTRAFQKHEKMSPSELRKTIKRTPIK